MQDLRTYIDKLRDDATACTAISQTASSEAKRKVFVALADTYRKLASEMERIAAAHAALDEKREKNLLGLLGTTSDPAASLEEIAKVLSSGT